MSHGLLSFFLFWLVFLIGDGAAEVAEKQGIIHEASLVNLRSGPGPSHPPKAVLRKGEKVTVESEEAGWYLVSSTDGERGYVSREFVLLIANAEIEVPAKEETRYKASTRAPLGLSSGRRQPSGARETKCAGVLYSTSSPLSERNAIDSGRCAPAAVGW